MKRCVRSVLPVAFIIRRNAVAKSSLHKSRHHEMRFGRTVQAYAFRLEAPGWAGTLKSMVWEFRIRYGFLMTKGTDYSVPLFSDYISSYLQRYVAELKALVLFNSPADGPFIFKQQHDIVTAVLDNHC